MTPKRIAALSALAVAILAAVVVVMLNRSGDDYTIRAEVDNAGQLIPGNEVRIGAVKIGQVTDVRLTDEGTAEVEMSIDEESTPVRAGTDATIRATSVLGLANRYIVLSPPPGESEPLPDGGTIELADTTSPVEVDAVLGAFDEGTREGLKEFIGGEATIYSGRSEEASESIRLLGPALSGTAGVMGELARDQETFASLLREGSTVARAVTVRRNELVDLISNANATMAAFGDEAVSLDAALGQLPDTMRRANTTFAAARAAFDKVDPLVAIAKPATKNLAPFLRQVRPLFSRAAKTVPKATAIVNTPGKANDLRNLLGRLPALSRVAKKTVPETIEFMDRSEGFMDLLRANTPDLFAAISNVGQATSYYDANGHYARVMPVMGALHYNAGLNELEPQDAVDRLDGFELGTSRRCPGGSVQPPPDGSAPMSVSGCNPLLTPPGP